MAPFKLLFLCTGNSCRSQMAEGLCRARWGDDIRVASAGIEAQGLNPLAVKSMAELGIDISGQSSTSVEALGAFTPDVVITVCGHAHETCPVFPGAARVLHRGFDDPPHLARNAAGEADALPHYRRVRDELRAFIDELPDWLRSRGVHVPAHA